MSINAHIAVMRNPFSTAVPTAKVPDGRSPTSLSIRNNITESFVVQSGKAVFCLTPFYSAPVQVLSDVTTSVTNPPPANAPAGTNPTVVTTTAKRWQFFNGPQELCYKRVADGVAPAYTKNFTSTDENPLAVPTGTYSNNKITRFVADGPDRSRIVSQGMRITAINNAELNAGWFEAIRVKSAYDCLDYQVTSPDDLITFVPGPYIENRLVNGEWANCPGYISGKLRDLQKHVFYLQCNGDREFYRTPDHAVIACDPALTTANATLHQIADGIPASQWADPDFDCVLVRVHCPAADAGNVALHGRLLMHAVQNLEVIYSAKSTFKKYETRCQSASGLVKKTTELINRDPKASILRLYNA